MAFFTSNISFSIFLVLASAIATCLGGPSQHSLSVQQRQECIHEHFSALLGLKRGFRFDDFSYTNLWSWNTDNRDCCAWEGITCDTSTGHVISLDLGGLHISGHIDFQSLSHLRSLNSLNLGHNWFDPSPIPSSIGQLNRLTHLNLSSGNFYGQIPMEMSSLISLVSLDLTFNTFYSIPLKLEKPSIEALIQNMSSLRELSLDYVDMSKGSSEWSEAISSALPSLRKLSMDGCGLSGPIHPSFFHLPFLSQLHLGSNNLSFAEFYFIGNLSSLTSLSLRFLSGEVSDKTWRLPRLSELDLSYNDISSAVLDFIIGNLSSLTTLRLSDCGLHGRFSDKIWSLPHLSELDLSSNDMSPAVLKFFGNMSSLASLSLSYGGLDGRYLDKISMLPCLTKLDLGFNNFSSVKPHIFGNFSSFKSLTQLRLWDCGMSGPLPTQLGNFTRLEYLDLSYNSFSGSIPSSYGNGLLNLKDISLSDNLLNGTIPSSLFSLPSLLSLSLSNNQLVGQLGEFHNASSSPLEFIYLSNNKLQGMIPRSIFQLRNLRDIYLNSNNFSDTLDLDSFLNITKLSDLALSDINLLVKNGSSNLTSISSPQLTFLSLQSCNIKRFPDFLRNQGSLLYLDLSSNKIDSKIPKWIWKVGNGSLLHLNLSHNALQEIEPPILHISSSSLMVLDLSSNFLQGSLPIPSSYLTFYSVSNNSLSGKIPVLICKLTSLGILDISGNNFSGHVPQCFGEMSSVLVVLNLQGNAFHGRLFQTFKEDCSLEILDFSDNQLEGQLPASLANCKRLMVLSLKNNHISGTFPLWIQGLANLRILILRSNHFYGPIQLPPTTQDFSSMLQIIDLSFNSFNGSLPSAMFWGWKGMVREDDSALEYLKIDVYSTYVITELPFYYQPIIIRSKTLEMHLQKIPTIFTLVDLSSNCLQGQIPDSIGILKSLRVLNMSHNGFIGRIPTSLKNLVVLESLDLSQNNISGHIPPELLGLTFLAVLNLSKNQLIGRIPHAKQFLTFTNESFQGNPGLCGPPLSKECEEINDAPSSTFNDPEMLSDSEYDWKIIAIGFGIGYGVGMGVFCWTLVLWTKGRRAYNKFVHKMLLLILPSAV